MSQSCNWLVVSFCVASLGVSHTAVLAQQVPIPEYLGVFALSADKLIELQPFQMPSDSTLVKWEGSDVGAPEVLRLVVYGDYPASSIALWKLHSSVTNRRVSSTKIPIRIKPQSGIQGLIGSLLLVEPQKGFEPGDYMIMVGQSGDAWSFSTSGGGGLFSSPPILSVCRSGNTTVAGTTDGILIFSPSDTTAPKFIKSSGKVEKLSRSGDISVVYGLSGDGASIQAIDIANATSREVALNGIKIGMLGDEIGLRRVYDLHFPCRAPSRIIVAATGFRSQINPNEHMGILTQPKKAKVIDIGMSSWDSAKLEEAVYCVAQMHPERLLIGTNGPTYALTWKADKEDWKLDKLDNGLPAIIYYTDSTVEGEAYAINEAKDVFVTTDAGSTWGPCETIKKADKIDVGFTCPGYLAYQWSGTYQLSTDGGKTFERIDIPAVSTVNCFNIDCGDARSAFQQERIANKEKMAADNKRPAFPHQFTAGTNAGVYVRKAKFDAERQGPIFSEWQLAGAAR